MPLSLATRILKLRTTTVYSKALAIFVGLMVLLGAAIVSLTQFILAREFDLAEKREADRKLRALIASLEQAGEKLQRALVRAESKLAPADFFQGSAGFYAQMDASGSLLEAWPPSDQARNEALQLAAPLLSRTVAPGAGHGYGTIHSELFILAWHKGEDGSITLIAEPHSQALGRSVSLLLGGTIAFQPLRFLTLGPPGTEDLLEMFTRNATTFVSLPGDRLIARRLLRAPDRTALGIVEIRLDRTLLENGQRALRVFFTILVLAGGLLFGLVWYVLDRTILQRVRELTRQVEAENRRGRLPVRLAFGGSDELGQLARRIEELAGLLDNLQKEYRAVVEDQTELICRFDPSLTLTFTNSAFRKFFDIPAECVGKSLKEFLPSETFEFLSRRLARLSPGDPLEHFQHAIWLPSMGNVWLRSTLRANFTDEGNLAGGQWVATDATREVEAELAIAESESRLRQLSARLLTSQEDERRRIARELHDSTAQILSALEMNVSLLEPLARDDRSRRLVAETRAIARECCRELRNISYLLHPPLLDEVGLRFAIQWFADGFRTRTGIHLTVDVPPNFPRLAKDVEAALFRVVQEATSNIYRHSGATAAWIRLAFEENGDIEMVIQDNGRGFPQADHRSPGIGLAGMRERLSLIGGELSIENSPSGVTLTVWIPASHAQNPTETSPRS